MDTKENTFHRDIDATSLKPKAWHYMTKSPKRRYNDMGLKRYKISKLISVYGKHRTEPGA